MNTGEIIGKFAEQRGKNIHQLAAEAGVPYTTLYAVVKRKSARVSQDIIQRVALALDVPDYMLLSGDNNINIPRTDQKPQDKRIEHRLDALEQVALISYLLTVAPPDIYPDLPDESKNRISINRRMLLARAKILSTPQPLTDDIVNRYHTNAPSQAYQQSISKVDLEASKGYEKWLRHISDFLCRYAALNPAGRKELEKRLGELERLEEYEDEILTIEVKKTVQETMK